MGRAEPIDHHRSARASATAVYDGLGRRISKTVSGTQTQFVYDSFDVVRGFVGGTPADYFRGLAIDETLARNGAEFFVADSLGSTLGLANAVGELATRYVYEPFGRTAVEGDASANPFQFTGRERDGAALYYYRARYY